MPRHRQLSLNASPPSQSRGGTEKLKMSRREGVLLSVIILLAVAICAVAFYKTGDPSLPHATRQPRRPESQRTDERRTSQSSRIQFVHRGKSFPDSSIIRTQETADARLDDRAPNSEILVEIQPETWDVQAEQEDAAQVATFKEDIRVPLLPSRNPYAHAQAVRSPDGVLLHEHRRGRGSTTSPEYRSTSPEPKPPKQPTEMADPPVAGPDAPNSTIPASVIQTERQAPVKSSQAAVHRHPGTSLQQSAQQSAQQSPNAKSRKEDPAVQTPVLSTAQGDRAQDGITDLQSTGTSLVEDSALRTMKSGYRDQTDHKPVDAGEPTPEPQPRTPTDSSAVAENPKNIKKRIAEKIKQLQKQWHDEAMHARDSRAPAAMNAEELHAHQSFIQEVLEHGLPSDQPRPDGKSVSLHPIVRVNNITTAEFEFRFASEFGLQPVVISNSQNDWFSPEKFTLEELRRQIGSKPVRKQHKGCLPGKKAYDTNTCHSIKESDPDLVGRRWASLKPTNLTEIGVDTYNEFLTKQIELAAQGRYIYAHEISGGWLPEVEAIIRQPKYFLNNVQDLDWRPNVDISERVRDTHFPSVFFGASGSSSPLHSDARMTRFWIMQLAGKKMLRLVPPAENWRGDASDGQEFQPSLFTVDLMHPDYDKHPNMHNMIVYETILEPGDLLFIPEGWGHQALNLEWTWMISSNYIDEHNIPNLLNLILYQKGPGQAFEEAEVDFDHFFLPLNNPSKNLTNLELDEYFQRLTLEYAEVSDAAMHHCDILKNLGIPPDDWRDHHSKRLMTVAFETNYVALAQWLYKQGVPLANDTYGRTMLKWVVKNGMERMEMWMRAVMGVDESDKLEDIPDEGPDDQADQAHQESAPKDGHKQGSEPKEVDKQNSAHVETDKHTSETQQEDKEESASEEAGKKQSKPKQEDSR